ncbi:MAG TPA: GTP-binding protein [Verrucomicrobiales bacterium]|jgi:Ni2+-binding GTPase involved in maturation of urease and hydrogenase|nr:GTP-binding protein [Verrucomicrobiales bacterium]
MSKSRYMMIGGFLGAGKTTTMLRLAEMLTERGMKVGLITNDQASGLVDTSLAENKGMAVEEIAGGCFCCRFSSLIEAARHLTESTRPDVFLAEPVGSCTDLVATVALPLQQIYGNQFTVAPYTVLVDPARAMRVFGMDEGRTFPEHVLYIYGKQLEEAEHIVINKADMVHAATLEELRAEISRRYPQAEVHVMSAREGSGTEPLLELLLSGESAPQTVMDVDYALYGEGEAMLGWLNGTANVKGDDFDGNAFLLDLATSIQKNLSESGADVAHLKMVISPDSEPYELAACNLTRQEGMPELSHRLVDPLDDATLLINCRAAGDPELLRDAVAAALDETAAKFDVGVEQGPLDYFKPGQPNPEHRVAAV